MGILEYTVGYLISIPLSWLMFRTAIMAGGEPETHPQGLLAVATFIPIVNILVSFLGMLANLAVHSKMRVDFFKTKKR